MSGLAFVGLRLIAALTINQSISNFVMYGWNSKAIGLGMFVVSITLWLYTERMALILAKKAGIEPWAERWSIWAVSMYGIYILIWQAPMLITRNVFGVWSTLTQNDGYRYWFFANPTLIGASIAAVLFVIGPEKVWRTLAAKIKSSNL